MENRFRSLLNEFQSECKNHINRNFKLRSKTILQSPIQYNLMLVAVILDEHVSIVNTVCLSTLKILGSYALLECGFLFKVLFQSCPKFTNFFGSIERYKSVERVELCKKKIFLKYSERMVQKSQCINVYLRMRRIKSYRDEHFFYKLIPVTFHLSLFSESISNYNQSDCTEYKQCQKENDDNDSKFKYYN